MTAKTPPTQMRKKPFDWFKTGTIWTFSVLLAVALNLALFSLMPRLIQRGPGERKEYEKLRTLDFIRFKKKEKPPEHTEKKKKPPQKKQLKKKDLIQKKLARPRPSFNRMRMPYELNPRLPADKIQLPTIDMKTISMDAPPIKDFYNVGELDGPLTALVRSPPVYPLMAKRRGIEGWVKVRFLVTDAGRVDNISILEAQPEKIFDKAVERCVRAWRFDPGTIEGEPVNAWAETVIRFELQ